MIPIEKLSEVRTLVVHGNCPDGLASAVILDDVLPRRKIVFAIHNITPLEAEPGMLFCDFCPPRGQVEEFRKVGTIVLDHHRTQRDLIESFEHHAFGDERRDPGVSGAVLAYRHVWRPIYESMKESGLAETDFQPAVVEDFAVLAGIRDTWQQQHPDWERACKQTETLLFYPQSYWVSEQRPEMLRTRNVEALMERMRVGEVAWQKKLEGSQRLAEKALYHQTGKGVRMAIVPARHVSDAADMVAPGTQLIVGFSFTVEEGEMKLILSTRSRGGYDCSKLCTFFGGGGHTAAAGCVLPLSLEDPNPYAMIKELLRKYEEAA